MKALIYLLVLLAAPAIAAETSPPAAPEAEEEAAKAPDSVMFTIDELNEIRTRAASGGREEGNLAAVESASLYLSTILFYGPTSWTIWLNGVPVNSGQELKQFEITDIGPNYVELLVPLSAQGMRPVRLSPNQTFIAKSGAVVEGKWNQ